MEKVTWMTAMFEEFSKYFLSELRSELDSALSRLNQEINMPNDERITRHDICELYKISLPTVHKYMQQGLPYEKMGRKTLFVRADVDKFFKSRGGKRWAAGSLTGASSKGLN